jgi:hypothetical protein
MSTVIDQAMQTLEKMPTEAQNMVFEYIQTLSARFLKQPIVGNPYPLRGTASIFIDPSESVLNAEEWNAQRGVLLHDSD